MYRDNQILQFKINWIQTVKPRTSKVSKEFIKNRLDKLLIEFILYYVRTKNGIFGKLQILILFLWIMFFFSRIKYVYIISVELNLFEREMSEFRGFEQF